MFSFQMNQVFVFEIVNKHNYRIWIANNSFIIVETVLNLPKINVGCAMSNKQTKIGP